MEDPGTAVSGPPWSLHACSVKPAQGEQLSLRTHVQLSHFRALKLILLDLCNLENSLLCSHGSQRAAERCSQGESKAYRSAGGEVEGESSDVCPSSLLQELPV